MTTEAALLRVLVIGAMLAHLAAGLPMRRRRRGARGWLFGIGSLLAACAVALRWAQVGHAPMQSLFEVFLCLGALMFPLSVLCRRWLGVRGGAGDALMAFLVLVPAAFVFDRTPRPLPPVLRTWLFGPHILSYLLGYVVMFKAGLQGIRVIRSGGGDAMREADAGMHGLVRLGFPLLTLGLVLGAVWGKRAWGDYWHWDPKEVWALAMWLTYVAYFHWRRITGGRRPRANAAVALAGCAAIIITLVWVNLSRLFAGLHSYAA